MIIPTRAFVLRTYDFRETSVLATLYTLECGKVKSISKGIRQLKSRQISHFDPPSLLQITLYDKPNRDLQLVSNTAIENHYPGIKADILTYTRVTYIFELIDRMTQVHLPHETLFRLMEAYLHFINGQNAVLFTHAFELKFLTIMGLFPNVLTCATCGGTITGDALFLMHRHGATCLNNQCDIGEEGVVLRRNTIEALFVLIKSTYNDLLCVSPQDFPLDEVGRLTRRYIRQLTDNRLKTLSVLDELSGCNSAHRELCEDRKYC